MMATLALLVQQALLLQLLDQLALWVQQAHRVFKVT
jgi:hypothetical protein